MYPVPGALLDVKDAKMNEVQSLLPSDSVQGRIDHDVS